MREGKYEQGHRDLHANCSIKTGATIQAHLGIALVYAKQLNFRAAYDHATEVIEIEPNNARAHALAGLALLCAQGIVQSAVERACSIRQLNPKEALAFGAAAEIDYYEGRARDAHAKALHAYNLDPDEPDYLMTLARASSRLEDVRRSRRRLRAVFLRMAPETDTERRDRIQGLIDFYRELAGLEVHQVSGASSTEVPFELGSDRRPVREAEGQRARGDLRHRHGVGLHRHL